MYKIVPAERQGRSKEAITKNRCKPSKNGLQRSFLAPPARLELTTFRLGGGPSILVRYGGIYTNYSVIQGSGIRTVRLLGGGRSIQLSYGGICVDPARRFLGGRDAHTCSILPAFQCPVNPETGRHKKTGNRRRNSGSRQRGLLQVTRSPGPE